MDEKQFIVITVEAKSIDQDTPALFPFGNTVFLLSKERIGSMAGQPIYMTLKRVTIATCAVPVLCVKYSRAALCWDLMMSQTYYYCNTCLPLALPPLNLVPGYFNSRSQTHAKPAFESECVGVGGIGDAGYFMYMETRYSSGQLSWLY